MTTPTRAERDEMRALLAKATPGPWSGCLHLSADADRTCGCGYRGGIWSDVADVMVCEIGGPVGQEGDEMIPRSDRPTQIADHWIIVHARTALPALLDELDRAEAENERLREQRDGHRRDHQAAAGRAYRLECETYNLENRLGYAKHALETAEATIARLTAPPTHEEGMAVFETVEKEYPPDHDPFAGERAALTAFLASRKGGQ